jgi:hypothetical protein
MRKPWGILAGIFAIIWSFALIALIAVYVISSMMYAEVGGDDGLRESWWLFPIFVTEVISSIGLAVSLIGYGFRR